MAEKLKDIGTSKKEHQHMVELNEVRANLERRKVQVAVVYTKMSSSSKRVLTTAMEIDAQIDKNAKDWQEFLKRLGKKNGVDLIKYNYQMNYKEGRFIAPTKEQQDEADKQRAIAKAGEVEGAGMTESPV